jgi:Tol biopolymer transport system component
MKSKIKFGLMIAVMVAMVSISGCVQNDYLLKSVTEILSEDGGRVDWCAANDHIFYDSKYDMWVMEPDGSNRACLTSGEFPGRYVGQPACSPDGQYILFQVEKEDHGCGL